MSAPVDVLAVIRFHADGMRNAAGTAEGVKLTAKACGNIADELGRVEAAVAELIAERDALREAVADALMDLPPMIAAADRGEKWVVTAGTRLRLERIRAALGRVGAAA